MGVIKKIDKNSKKRADVDQNISDYPDAVFRHFYEMRLEYVLA